MLYPLGVKGNLQPLGLCPAGLTVALLLFTICPPAVVLHEIAPVVTGSGNIAEVLTDSLDPNVDAYGQHPSAGSSDLAPILYAGGCC